jgi:hypothetical protein
LKLDISLCGTEYRFVQSFEDFGIGIAGKHFVDSVTAARPSCSGSLNKGATVH